MSYQTENQNPDPSQTSISERPSQDGQPEETILAGAPDGAPYADDSSGGKDLGNAAANAGYKDNGSRGTAPDIEGFASGTSGTSDLGASTSGNGAGNGSTNLSGADPTRTIDQSPVPNTGNPGAAILSDDGETD